MIKFLIEKEFKQLLRNSFLPKLILVFPCMIMLLMPWAVNLESRIYSLNIVDNDHSAISQLFSQLRLPPLPISVWWKCRFRMKKAYGILKLERRIL